MSAGYTVKAGAAIALTAATAKTVLNVINAANSLIKLVELSLSFDGVTSSAVPALVELCSSTQATAGTAGSSPTPTQIRGPVRTVQATAGVNYSAEPTVLTPLKEWLVPVFMGSLTVQFPLGREPEQITTADGLCLRITAPAAVNVRCYIEFEEG